MAGTVKVKYKHTQPVILHADMMDDFKKALGGKDVSVFFREIQEDVVDKYRKEQKKATPPAKGALINSLLINKKLPSQTTLDVFKHIDLEKVRQEINNETDKTILARINTKAKLCLGFTKTRMHQLRFEP